MNKKAVSQVVGAVLLILLGITVLIVLGGFLVNFVGEQSGIAEAKAKFFSERMDITMVEVDPGDDKMLSVTIKKQSGKTAFVGTEVVQSTNLDVDVVSVVDLSGSMVSCFEVINNQDCCLGDLGGNYYLYNNECYGIDTGLENICTNTCFGVWEDKLTPLQEANKQLVDAIFNVPGNSELGLVGYSTGISSSIDLTNDINLLNTEIDSWVSIADTCICCGINEAVSKLGSSPADKSKSIIVMSDGLARIECGEQGTGDANQDAIQAACDANAALENLNIYSVGVGSEVDEATLQEIANCGNGQYFPVSDVNDLTQIYETVGEQIIVNYESLQVINYLAVIFSTSGETYKTTIDDLPGVFESKKYEFNLNGEITGDVDKIEIYPVIVVKSGKEITGPLLDSWVF